MENSKTLVRFYRDKFLLGHQSEAAGHPVYEDRDYLEIYTPGNPDPWVTEATEKYQKQYAEAYAAYKAGLEPSVDGVPLEQWPRMTPATVANYKAAKVTTVEQVAEMSDQVCNKLGMGAMSDKLAAKTYLANAKDSALAQKLALVNERQQAQIDDLTAQIKVLSDKHDKTLTLKKVA